MLKRKEKSFSDLANKVIKSLGGPENIKKVWNCMTRL